MDATDPAGSDVRLIGRLRWRCRRGMKELDLLLRRYLDEEFSSATAADQNAFCRLLDCQDPTLYAYCMGNERPPSDDICSLIDRITRAPAWERQIGG
ncbi:MAG: succinate dehydrogenase assembly factor 2 [Steroidobacteraceae bacterium]|jgi:antitoxin CptB